jgi:HTH-type transcriptional regulator/antitoxin HigA
LLLTVFRELRYQLNVTIQHEYTKYNTPGQLIEELLRRRGWTQKILAIILGTTESGINRLIAGKRSIDATMAISLGEVFAIPAEVFLELQRSFDLAQARIISRPDPERATRARVFGDLPVADMIKRGWLDADDVREVSLVQAALLKFFKADSLDDIEVFKHSAKKTNTEADPTPTQLAWIYRVKQIASEMLVTRYSHSSGRDAVSKLNGLLSAPEEARKVPRILAESGIRYVIVESLPSAKIDGVTFWLDDASPVVGMTLRHDRIDNFWFVLRHEIEHVLRLHGRGGRDVLDVELEGARAGTGPDVSEEERVANDAAADFCVPRISMEQFMSRKAPFFAERDILGFARTLRIHPGLVAGQLQHRTSRYDRFRNHLVKIRSAVAPSAMVDGWGDVAPVGM